MVYIPETQKQTPPTCREINIEDLLEQHVAHHRELEYFDSSMKGILIRYLPEDFESNIKAMPCYIRLLNQAIYEELRGRRYLFFQQMGNDFLLRISYYPTSPALPELNKLIQRIVLTGWEVDAAMRAAAFSH